MGLVTLTAHVSGTILTAAALNSNFNAIVNQVNGNLEAANIAALAITGAKIASGAVSGPKIAMGSDAQGDILYHNGTNYARLAAGNSGEVLKTQGAGANPAYATVLSLLPAGSVVQVVHTPFNTYGSFSSSFPNDDTKPTWAEGTEIAGLQTAITPKFSNSRIFVEAMLLFGASSSGERTSLAVFQDPSGTDECKAVGFVSLDGAGYDSYPCFVAYEMESGVTTQITFKFRGGIIVGGGADYYNGSDSARFFGGALISYARITEVKV